MLNLPLEQLINIIKNNNGDLKTVINNFNISINHNKEEADHIAELFEDLNIEVRVCNICNEIIIEGYCIYDGDYYACTDDCRSKIISEEEYEESYWTDWTEVNEKGQPYGGISYEL